MRLIVGWNVGAIITTVGVFSAAAVGGYIGALAPTWPWWLLAVLALVWGLSVSVPQVLSLSESQRELRQQVEEMTDRAVMQAEIAGAMTAIAEALVSLNAQVALLQRGPAEQDDDEDDD